MRAIPRRVTPEKMRPKKQNAPISDLSGRTFLQETVYHIFKFCQGKLSVF
jgi:hypothetical protein